MSRRERACGRERARGARQALAQAAGAGARAERHGRARGARRQLGGRCARGRARQARGLARAVHSVHSAWFSTRFFDSVFFLSH